MQFSPVITRAMFIYIFKVSKFCKLTIEVISLELKFGEYVRVRLKFLQVIPFTTGRQWTTDESSQRDF